MTGLNLMIRTANRTNALHKIYGGYDFTMDINLGVFTARNLTQVGVGTKMVFLPPQEDIRESKNSAEGARIEPGLQRYQKHPPS